MILTRAMFERAVNLLASDTTTFAHAEAPAVRLAMEPFTPTPDLVVADLTPLQATFSGYGAISLGQGTQPTATDPASSDYLLQAKLPAGGLRWETAGTTNLPQTIYGWWIESDDSATLFASALLPTPIVLTAGNQVVEVSDIIARYLASGVV